MNRGLTVIEALTRRRRAFQWLLRDEEKRWPIFKALRDQRYNPVLRPIKTSLIELTLIGMAGNVHRLSAVAIKELGPHGLLNKKEE